MENPRLIRSGKYQTIYEFDHEGVKYTVAHNYSDSGLSIDVQRWLTKNVLDVLFNFSPKDVIEYCGFDPETNWVKLIELYKKLAELPRVRNFDQFIAQEPNEYQPILKNIKL